MTAMSVRRGLALFMLMLSTLANNTHSHTSRTTIQGIKLKERMLPTLMVIAHLNKRSEDKYHGKAHVVPHNTPLMHPCYLLDTRQLGVNVLGALRGGGDEGQVDACLGQVAELALGLLSSLSQPERQDKTGCVSVLVFLADMKDAAQAHA
eukprot:1148829-Pelagomonas_calceolata.AAC.4